MKYIKRKTPVLAMLFIIFAISIICSLTGCSQKTSVSVADSNELSLVATTTMLADLSNSIGKGRIQTTSLMGPGVDPHLYQATAGNVTDMQNADIVLYNGLHLEGKMGDIFSSLHNRGKSVICIEDGLNSEKLLSAEDNQEQYDPHIWFDVSLWKNAAQHLADSLISIDPEYEDLYSTNLQQYTLELDDLETYINERIAELPESSRVLITAHDAFQYFGRSYGFQVIGLQGISTDAEAGTSDVSSLAEYIAENKIKAIFVESSVPSKTIEALQAAVQAKNFDTSIGGELYSDSLGGTESGFDTYILTFRANIDTIVDALK